MDDSDESARRTIAACLQCGSVYAAIDLGGEDLRPIGSRDGCTCGSTAFAELEEADETTFDEGETVDGEE